MGDTKTEQLPRRHTLWVGVAGLMLLPVLPVLPERIGGEVAWEPGDFMFLGILCVASAVVIELALRTPSRLAYRVAAGIAASATLLQIWLNLAVGIIGSEDNPGNAIYLGVLAVIVIGPIVARFQARGMCHAMIAAAIAQLLALLVALAAGLGFTGPITVFFTTLWLTSAWLFRRAADEKAAA